MALLPTRLLLAKPTSVAPAAYWTVSDNDGYANFAYRWNVLLNITPQAHSVPTTTTPYFYTAVDIKVGDWFSNAVGGAAWQIISISTANSSYISCQLEDIGRYNTFADSNQSGDGGPANNITGFVFTLDMNGTPLLNPLTVNVLTSQWQSDIESRLRTQAEQQNIVAKSTAFTITRSMVGKQIVTTSNTAIPTLQWGNVGVNFTATLTHLGTSAITMVVGSDATVIGNKTISPNTTSSITTLTANNTNYVLIQNASAGPALDNVILLED